MVASKQTAVCLSPVKRKSSNWKRFNDEVILSNTTNIENVDVQFDFKPFDVINDAGFFKVNEVNHMEAITLVSLRLYLCPENRPVVPVMLSYRAEPLHRKDILANDDTGTIKLALWNDQINTASVSGTHIIKIAIAKKFNNLAYISTNTNSKITVVSENQQIKQISSSESQLHTKELAFPANNVRSITWRFWCEQCKRFNKNASTNQLLFSCENCSSVTMSCRIKSNVEARMDFDVEGIIQTYVISGPQIEEYFSRQCKP